MRLAPEDIEAIAEKTAEIIESNRPEAACSLGLTREQADRLKGLAGWMDHAAMVIADVILKTFITGILALVILGMVAWIAHSLHLKN